MKTKFTLALLFIAFSTITLFTMCKKEKGGDYSNSEKGAYAQSINNGNANINSFNEKSGSTCSPVGYCTGGVRLAKGGYIQNGNVYNGVHWSGAAKLWKANAQAAGYVTSSLPKVGAIVVWGSNSSSVDGHVGIVTKQLNGVWYYKAMNDYPSGFNQWSERKISEYAKSTNLVTPLGYIYTW